MRASTLFALTVAVLLGLATAVTLKITGVFDTKVPPPVVETKKPDINILAVNRPILKGILIDAPWVSVRPLRPEEIKEYEAHKEDYLPAFPTAVMMRSAAKNLDPDKPLLKSDLEPMGEVKNVSNRLLANMRAI